MNGHYRWCRAGQDGKGRAHSLCHTPSAVPTYNNPLTFRASREEKAQLRAEAARRGTTVGEMVREALVQAGALSPRNTAAPSPDTR